MESGKLKQVPLESMPKGFEERMHRFWKVFDSGVKKAKAENERLGIPSRDSEGDYSTEDLLAKAPFVAESDSE